MTLYRTLGSEKDIGADCGPSRTLPDPGGEKHELRHRGDLALEVCP